MRTVIDRFWRWLRRVRVSRWVMLGVGLVAVGVLGWVPVDWSAWVAGLGASVVSAGVPGWVTVGGVVVLAAVGLVQGVARARARSEDSVRAQPQGPVRPIPGWAIWAGLVLVVAVGAGAAWALVAAFGSDSPQNKNRLEAIKLAGSIAVGTGGVAALLLAARRQRATELGLLQQEQRAADDRHDADERRVTELYTAAADQLASDKAPVRMAGLYTLERIGQNNPDHRQTIVNLLCAYLRMPYHHPDADPADDTTPVATEGESALAAQPLLLDLAPALAEAAGLTRDGAEQQRQELEVRRTAQQLLTRHLFSNSDTDGVPTNPDFWSGPESTNLDLDLAGATLHHWNLAYCEVGHARFDDAYFHGQARFEDAHFCGHAGFNGAHFHGYADFNDADFHLDAGFFDADFHGDANFNDADFHLDAVFSDADFHRDARFWRTGFHGDAKFFEANLHGVTGFDDADFHGIDDFRGVWARLDTGFPGASPWPPGWRVVEDDPGDGREGRWGRLVPVEDTERVQQDGDEAAEPAAGR
ncbi:pentapeptide repeat-containing protein [Saccharopolyspora cebuensis]|uniref:Pentapeptide repeat-containing protein n=1 Tax=Saccharopolyspora cebuensis TaxID=418759 RepID=A0ABV4CG40_9PSEU